jgi:GNAT superfamily N-acetyltransferase
MLIRKATTTDQEKIVKLRIALQHHLEQSNPVIWRVTKMGQKELVQQVNRMMTDDASLVMVTEHNTTIVGFANARILQRTEYKPTKVGFIMMIFIEKHYRRRGIGTQLINELCKYFEAENIQNITLRYVLGNQEAEAFWHHLGFTPIIHTAYTDLETLKTRLRNQ